MGATSSKSTPQTALKRVTMIGVPVGYGQDWELGVEDAPDSFRAGGIGKVIEEEGYVFVDDGDVKPLADPMSPQSLRKSPRKEASSVPGVIKNGEVIGATLKPLYEKILAAATSGSFVLNVGGDHSLGSVSLLSMLEAYPDLGVIWVDAHGDCNTPTTSESGNYHGMSAAHALGWFQGGKGWEWLERRSRGRPSNQGAPVRRRPNYLPEERLVYIGLRDLDQKEKELLLKSKVKVFTMRDIDKLGIGRVMEEALEHLARSYDDVSSTSCLSKRSPGNSFKKLHARLPPIHLSLDVDSIDPSVAPGTGTKARGGLSYRESHFICHALAETGRLVGMDVVEVNPRLEEVPTQGRMHGDSELVTAASETVRLGIELVSCALGRRLL